MPEIAQEVERITAQAMRIVRVLVATLFATASSGCATLMQPFSTVQPTAALVEPDWSGSASVPATPFTKPAADGGWTTRTFQYRTSAEPSANFAKL